MDPATISLIMAALGGAQALTGAFLKKGQRPPWQIPGAAYESLSNARQMASATTRPGNQQEIDNISRNAGSTINVLRRSLGSGSQLLSGASQINNNTNQALAANSAANDRYRFNAKMNLQNELGRFSAFQREKFVKDVFEPYEQRAQTKNMLIGAGMQNAFGGLDNFARFKQDTQMMNTMFGQQGLSDFTNVFSGKSAPQQLGEQYGAYGADLLKQWRGMRPTAQ